MILESDFDMSFEFIAKAAPAKKIHLFRVVRGIVFPGAECHAKIKDAEVDNIENLEWFISILKDERMCKTCLREIKKYRFAELKKIKI